VRAPGLQAVVGRVPSPGAITSDALYSLVYNRQADVAAPQRARSVQESERKYRWK